MISPQRYSQTQSGWNKELKLLEASSIGDSNLLTSEGKGEGEHGPVGIEILIAEWITHTIAKTWKFLRCESSKGRSAQKWTADCRQTWRQHEDCHHCTSGLWESALVLGSLPNGFSIQVSFFCSIFFQIQAFSSRSSVKLNLPRDWFPGGCSNTFHHRNLQKNLLNRNVNIFQISHTFRDCVLLKRTRTCRQTLELQKMTRLARSKLFTPFVNLHQGSRVQIGKLASMVYLCTIRGLGLSLCRSKHTHTPTRIHTHTRTCTHAYTKQTVFVASKQIFR